ncbi:MAG TPA: TolC family protein [bacterium]|nr:TolC family protein [bacterium]
MKKILSLFFLFVFSISTAAFCLEVSKSKDARGEGIDTLIGRLEKIIPPPPITLTLDDCVEIALLNNPELKIKQSILNSVDGDQMIDRSRFFSHVDIIGNFGRSQGSLLKSYYPSHNPMAVTPLGGLDSGGYSSGSSSGSSDISSLAAQFGVSDISSLMSSIPAEYQQLAEQYLSGAFRPALNRDADQVIPEFPDFDPEQLQALIDALAQVDPEQITGLINSIESLNNLLASTSSSDRTTLNNEIAVKYSRRLLEWGRDSSSSAQIRANRRLASHNYQQKVRDIVANVRTSFFHILLKKQQIETRQELLAAYEENLIKKQKRYDIAKDVPRIDVLTAELDVLEQKNRINSLKAALMNKELELLKLLDMPFGAKVNFKGELRDFNYSLDQIVRNTSDNSFHVAYLREELKEDEREFRELAWDYKPVLTAKAGVENHRNAVGLSLNNSNQTYGLDLGVSQHLNLPTSTSSFGLSSNRTENNYTLSLGAVWNVYDNTKRKGVEKKHLEKLSQTRMEFGQALVEEEMEARKAHQTLVEAMERLKLQEDIVNVARQRLEITLKLREYGKAQDYQVDQRRNDFFSQQDKYFSEQENLIAAQENLRRIMGVFQ